MPRLPLVCHPADRAPRESQLGLILYRLQVENAGSDGGRFGATHAPAGSRRKVGTGSARDSGELYNATYVRAG